MPITIPYRGCLILVATVLATGCSLHLQTRTVRSDDTYERWDARMQAMPFVFHDASGREDVFAADGKPWDGPAPRLDGMDHVEVYVGNFDRPYPASCTSAPPPAAPGHGDANVVAVLCDGARTVVSYGDEVLDRVLAAKPRYLPRVRHLLLEGIFESVAQEPEPYRD